MNYEAPELAAGEKRYKWSLWWVEKRALLAKIGLGIWAVVDAILIIFALWTMVDTFLISYENERSMAAGFAANQEQRHIVTMSNAPEPVKLSSDVSVFSLGDGRYDFYATIENPNEKHWLEFDYYFVYGNTLTETKHGFVFPIESKPLVDLAVSAEIRPTNAKVVIDNLDWHFVSPHLIPDFSDWREDRLDFRVTDAEYIPSLEIDKSVGRSTFTITNRTAFGYWEPLFYVLLYRGASVVGVTSTTIDQFFAGTSRTVEQNWFGALSAVSDIEVIPEIDLFDSSVYMPLKGESEIDLRERIFEGRRR